MDRITADPVVRVGATLGEGARWDSVARVLRFVDAASSVLYEYQPDRGLLSKRQLALPIAAFAFSRDGRAIATTPKGFAVIDVEARLVGSAMFDGDEERLNDGRCDAAGRFWAATATSGDLAGKGALYSLDSFDATPKVHLDGIRMGNGLGWSPDNRTMYVVDSMKRRIDAHSFDLDSGTLLSSECLVQLPDDDGLPDGLAIDRDGSIWVAIWGCGEVRRFTGEGKLDRAVSTAAENTTSCALTDAGIMYITSAAVDDEIRPHAGDLFGVDVGVAGVPEQHFAGDGCAEPGR